MKRISVWLLGLGLAGVAFGQAAVVPVGTALNIFDNQKTVVVKTTKGLERPQRTGCGHARYK